MQQLVEASEPFFPPTLSEIEDELSAIEAELERRSYPQRLRRSLPDAYQCFLKPSRYKAVYGGRGSAKSWGLGTLLLLYCVENPGTRAVCIREIQKSLDQSVKRLLEDLITRFELDDLFRVLNTHIETPGDGIITFQGMQNHTAVSIKSLEGFKIAWVEEAQSLSTVSLRLLRPTIRATGSELWFSWNPDTAKDPVDKFFRGSDPPTNAIIRETSFRDNPHFTPELQEELDTDFKADFENYTHVWGGGYVTKSTARVFKNWKKEEFVTPSDAMFLFGADWGFSVDPSVLVRMYIDGKKLYIDQEAYEVGCEIDHTPALFDSLGDRMARKWKIMADSARPETISYMQRNGYPLIEAAKKGPGSVEEGIIFLQGYEIIIHPRCLHTLAEFGSYSYKRHPLTNDVTPILQDKKNHVIDAVRYAIEPVRAAVEPPEFAVW